MAPVPTSSAGGGGRIRTYEGISQQIYSLPPLAAWVPLLKMSRVFCGASHVVSMLAVVVMGFAQLSTGQSDPPSRALRADSTGSQRPRPLETIRIAATDLTISYDLSIVRY